MIIGMEVFFKGFLLQASLILVLGAQNLFVLESGIKKNYQLMVATTCSVIDSILIFIGVMGLGVLLSQSVIFKIALGVVGAGFLLFYSFQKFKEFFHHCLDDDSKVEQEATRLKTMGLILSFTLLNPHVYLDTFVLIGGASAQFILVSDKVKFASGAAAFSWLWFFCLATLASIFHRTLQSVKAMRMIALGSGLVLLYFSIVLLLESYTWIKAL